MNIAVLLYDRFTALDAIGPYEVLSRLPGAALEFVAAEAGPVRTDNGMLTLIAERSIADARALGRPPIAKSVSNVKAVVQHPAASSPANADQLPSAF